MSLFAVAAASRTKVARLHAFHFLQCIDQQRLVFPDVKLSASIDSDRTSRRKARHTDSSSSPITIKGLDFSNVAGLCVHLLHGY